MSATKIFPKEASREARPQLLADSLQELDVGFGALHRRFVEGILVGLPGSPRSLSFRTRMRGAPHLSNGGGLAAGGTASCVF
jgi:hypothetical protein